MVPLQDPLLFYGSEALLTAACLKGAFLLPSFETFVAADMKAIFGLISPLHFRDEAEYP